MSPQSATISTTDDRLADTDITDAIELLFLLQKGVTSQLIDVRTHEGIVELTGFTSCLLSRERAEEMAKAVRGVRGVINELEIRTPDIPDEELLHSVEQALKQDPATREYNVRCQACDGRVTVEGTLQSWAEQQLVLQVLKSVRGVREIEKRLNTRDEDVTNSDKEIKTQLLELLEWDIRIKPDLITIQVNQGVVTLIGTVGTATEHDRVVATAYLVGATQVDASNLFVAQWAMEKTLRRQQFTVKADEEVAQAVRDILSHDPRVRAFNPIVHVREGVVTLAGTVSNLRARQAAEQDAYNVVGVREVHNLLQVRIYLPSPDASIKQYIRAVLAADAYVGLYNFRVNVSYGKVHLYGTVCSHYDQQRAADLASSVLGVVELTNWIQVGASREVVVPRAASINSKTTTPPASPDPDQVLEQRLRNRYYWSALLHKQEIDLTVRKGRVTLTGTVDSRLERQQAATEAIVCGAREVNNHLHPTHS